MEGADRTRATAALAVAVTAISFAAIFIREAAPTHPLLIAGVRLAIAATLLAPLSVRAIRRGSLPRPVLGRAAVAGVLYGLHFGTWIQSLSLTTVAASVTIVTSTPLLLAAVALATGKDRPDRRHFVAIALALVGVAIIAGHDALVPAGLDALWGDLLALAGAAAMAAYLVTVRALGKLDVWAFQGVACAVGAVVLLGTAAATGVPLEVPSTEALGFIALSALFPQLVGHGLLTWSLRHLRPTVVGLATVGEPVGSTLLAWLWLDEGVRPLTALGCLVTLVAVGLSLWQPRART